MYVVKAFLLYNDHHALQYDQDLIDTVLNIGLHQCRVHGGYKMGYFLSLVHFL